MSVLVEPLTKVQTFKDQLDCARSYCRCLSSLPKRISIEQGIDRLGQCRYLI